MNNMEKVGLTETYLKREIEYLFGFKDFNFENSDEIVRYMIDMEKKDSCLLFSLIPPKYRKSELALIMVEKDPEIFKLLEPDEKTIDVLLFFMRYSSAYKYFTVSDWEKVTRDKDKFINEIIYHMDKLPGYKSRVKKIFDKILSLKLVTENILLEWINKYPEQDRHWLRFIDENYQTPSIVMRCVYHNEEDIVYTRWDLLSYSKVSKIAFNHPGILNNQKIKKFLITKCPDYAVLLTDVYNSYDKVIVANSPEFPEFMREKAIKSIINAYSGKLNSLEDLPIPKTRFYEYISDIIDNTNIKIGMRIPIGMKNRWKYIKDRASNNLHNFKQKYIHK